MPNIPLDIRTLLFSVTLIRFAQVFALAHVWYTHKQYPPARDWAIGSLLSSMGILLIGLRDVAPLWVSVPVANSFLIPGWMIFNFGVARAADRNPPWLAGCLVSIASVASLYWFSIVDPVYVARLVIFNAAELFFDGYAVYCCLAYSHDNRKTTFRIVAGLLSLVMVFCTLRTLDGLTAGQTSILAQSAAQVRFFVVSIFSSIIATIMMVLLTAQKLQEDVRELIRQREMERDSAQLSAITDVLTGLPNRRRFDEALKVEFYRLKRSGAPLSLILLDVDHFKNFNDRYGHLAGDKCLRRLAETMRHAVTRASDLVARYGGEEIAVVLPETGSQGAEAMAERIRLMVEQLAIPHESSAVAGHVTVSLGVATVETTGMESPDEVVALADKALYLAKQSGRNRVELISLRQGGTL